MINENNMRLTLKNENLSADKKSHPGKKAVPCQKGDDQAGRKQLNLKRSSRRSAKQEIKQLHDRTRN